MSLITCIFCKCQIPGGSPANLAKYEEHLQVQLSLVVVVVVIVFDGGTLFETKDLRSDV